MSTPRNGQDAWDEMRVPSDLIYILGIHYYSSMIRRQFLILE